MCNNDERPYTSWAENLQRNIALGLLTAIVFFIILAWLNAISPY
ncbi:MAG: hypothetical protein WAU00_19590 [Caldilinea sp.]|nr:hypothetical protein [Caldilinea sp.]HRA65466.1 hypothetical protein [Caldilinea sp.]